MHATAGDLYDELGLTRFVNAWGTVTDVGGSLMAAEVTQAMARAATAYVDIAKLMRRSGEHLARRIGVDGVCITAGAAAGVVLGSGVLLDQDAGPGPRNGRPGQRVVALAGHATEYLRAAVPSSADLVELSGTTLAELESTAERLPAFLFVDAGIAAVQGLDLLELIGTAHRLGLSTLLDAAAELPPRNNLTSFHRAGATIVVFSGGKQICGPQSSGFIVGSEQVVEECLARSTPNHGVGRAMKVDKETIAGLVRAIELYLNEDESTVAKRQDEIVSALMAALALVEGLCVRRGFGEDHIRPAMIPRVFVRPLAGTVDALRSGLAVQPRPVLVGASGDEICLNPQCLQIEDVEPIVAALRAVSSELQAAASA